MQTGHILILFAGASRQIFLQVLLLPEIITADPTNGSSTMSYKALSVQKTIPTNRNDLASDLHTSARVV